MTNDAPGAETVGNALSAYNARVVEWAHRLAPEDGTSTDVSTDELVAFADNAIRPLIEEGLRGKNVAVVATRIPDVFTPQVITNWIGSRVLKVKAGEVVIVGSRGIWSARNESTLSPGETIQVFLVGDDRVKGQLGDLVREIRAVASQKFDADGYVS